MPVGGFVARVLPERMEAVLAALSGLEGLTVYGHDDRGHLVLVLESETSEEMERLAAEVLAVEGVLSLDLAYLHAEDEVERIERGELKPEVRFHRLRSPGVPAR